MGRTDHDRCDIRILFRQHLSNGTNDTRKDIGCSSGLVDRQHFGCYLVQRVQNIEQESSLLLTYPVLIQVELEQHLNSIDLSE